MKGLLVFLCALVLSQQAVINESRPNLGIPNGQVVADNSIPYQVFVWIFPPLGNVDRYACGGVLISENYVLTSAQCVSRINSVTVYAGIDSPFPFVDDGLAQFRNARLANGKIHERFNPITLENNIGLIKLTPGFQLNQRVTLAPLASQSDASNTFVGELNTEPYEIISNRGQQGRISGRNVGTNYRVLTAANNTVISNAECNRVYSNIRDYEICLSGAGNKRACARDEGGPLVIGNTVQGIISFRNVVCNSDSPTVITRVASFLSWIQANSDWKP